MRNENDNRPTFSEEEAVSFTRQFYGINGTARRLASYADQNFLIEGETGSRFVLKIYNSNLSEALLDFQVQLLERLASREIPCPPVISPSGGDRRLSIPGKNGCRHWLKMIGFLPGHFLAELKTHSPELIRNTGRLLARLDQALAGFSHAGMHQETIWDLKNSARAREYLDFIDDPKRRSLVETHFTRFETRVQPRLRGLPECVIHNDGNDHNLLTDGPDGRSVTGVIDFGDALHTFRVCEPAIAATYMMLDKPDPLKSAAQLVAGYNEIAPLRGAEFEVVFDLIIARLCTSVCMSSRLIKQNPDNAYFTVTHESAWRLLETLDAIHPRFATYVFREACGLPPCPKTGRVVRWLRGHQQDFASVLDYNIREKPLISFNFSESGSETATPELRSDVAAYTRYLFAKMERAGVPVALGAYNEDRAIYDSPIFKADGEPRTVHLGVDLFAEPGAVVRAPLDGRVYGFRNNDNPLDYGPTIVLEHEMGPGRGSFYTLYGHLTQDSLVGLSVGKTIRKGEILARIGDFPVNGNWPPHLHFQIMPDMLDMACDFPGVAMRSERAVWLSLCIDPNLALGVPDAKRQTGNEALIEARRRHLGPSLSLAYREPLKMVRGSGAYLYDETGRAYLDLVNNVCHVGHCHPSVVRAAQNQIATLNTNTRYLHDSIVRYAERLCATLPAPLRVCFFVCTGSEANDLALRMARAHAKARDVIVVDGAYHGNLTSLIELSPYKFDGPGGAGRPAHVHQVVMPDTYRGPYKAGSPSPGPRYAAHVARAVQDAALGGAKIAAFFCESLLGCGGQIVLPDGYLAEAYRSVRAAGGLCIADEVQVGFGRVGDHFWGFETQGVTPDIVTLGKPIGNGHPMAAVITTPEIAASFNNGMEYFNTFGGNPVSCEIGLAVLDVIEAEGLRENARRTGLTFKRGLQELMAKHPLIGDVRGMGLFLGVELVRDATTLEPAAEEAAHIIECMKDHGILLSTDGPLHNVLKIKPPIVFNEDHAGIVLETLDRVLSEELE